MYTLKQIAAILGVKNKKIPASSITTLLTDSRKLTHPESSIFFALPGPIRNGQLFIPELYKSGLRHFVVSEDVNTKTYKDAVFFKVQDVLQSLQKLVAFRRSQFTIPVIGITGSNGKTIVKEWLYQLLQEDYDIIRSPKSYNSQIGVPLSVWQITTQNTLAIFEAGISLPKEMENLAEIIKPTIGVLTHLGAAHSEGFLNDNEKLHEKLKLFEGASVVVFNGDNEMVSKAIQKSGRTHFSWGKQKRNNLQVLKISKSGSFTSISLITLGKHFEIKIPFIDDASIENAITCCAVLVYLKLDFEVIQTRMFRLEPINMRLEFKKGVNNCIVINDSYSADTDSLSIALDFLKQQAKGLKKTVILSDFLQSSNDAVALYNNILEQLQKHNVSRIIGVGEQMLNLMPKLLAEKNSKILFSAWLSTKDLLRHWQTSDFKDEAILIKGARLFEFEEIAAQLEQKAHQTILEINLNAIAHNFKTFQQMLRPSTKMMVMVKAFAYGSGGSEVAGLLQYLKADYLGVAYADEGVELRKAGIILPIMVLNPEVTAFDAITDHQLEPDIFSFDQLHAFEKHIRQAGLKNYPIHVEIETGMNRLGFNVSDISKLAAHLKNNEYLRVQSVFSHLAASEDKVEDAFTIRQQQLLVEATKVLENSTGYPFLKHIANSSAILRFPQLQMDMVRLGIGLYGVATAKNGKNLQPALTLKSNIAQLKHIKKGETVSYNRRGVVQENSVIATVRIGYADGYSRRLGNGVGYMLVKNKKAPVIGTVCMDMVMIDVTHIKGVVEGEEVIVFGSGLPVQELAQSIGTIPYEIMTGISQRVKRVYWSE